MMMKSVLLVLQYAVILKWMAYFCQLVNTHSPHRSVPLMFTEADSRAQVLHVACHLC